MRDIATRSDVATVTDVRPIATTDAGACNLDQYRTGELPKGCTPVEKIPAVVAPAGFPELSLFDSSLGDGAGTVGSSMSGGTESASAGSNNDGRNRSGENGGDAGDGVARNYQPETSKEPPVTNGGDGVKTQQDVDNEKIKQNIQGVGRVIQELFS